MHLQNMPIGDRVGPMAQLYPLRAEKSQAGGILARFPSGKTLTATWLRNSPSRDTKTDAKEVTVQLLQQLLDENCHDDANRTNWVSFTAAAQRIISDWSERRRTDLYAETTPENPSQGQSA